VRAVAPAEAVAGGARPLVAELLPVAPTAAETPAEAVAAAVRAGQPAEAVVLAGAGPKPLAARPMAAVFLAGAGPKPLAAWPQEAAVVATAEPLRLVVPRPAGPQQAVVVAAAAAVPQGAAALPVVWLPQPEAEWAASRWEPRTPRGRRS
jgi:hypothetical protein